MSRPTKISIDLAALKHNLQQVRRMAPKSAVLAMVKSNAYGHGLVRIAQAIPEADAFGVACSEEGLLLRQADIKNPIVLMEGLFSDTELTTAVSQNFTLVVHHAEQIKIFEKNARAQPLSVWLKINTGMNRLGFAPEAVKQAYERLMNCSSVKKPIGLMTHFAEADALDQNSTLQQIEIFNKSTRNLKGPKSLANSAGIIAWPHTHADWVRPGIMLYGASPMANQQGSQHDLRPVMTLSSELIAIHQVAKESRIGYGGTWTCVEDMPIGIVGIGYGDGYPRHIKNGAPVLVNGRSCPLVGRVAMDMLAVDLRSDPGAKVGDSVVLWGDGLPVEIVAEQSETIGYELLTRITQRVHVVVK